MDSFLVIVYRCFWLDIEGPTELHVLGHGYKLVGLTVFMYQALKNLYCDGTQGIG